MEWIQIIFTFVIVILVCVVVHDCYGGLWLVLLLNGSARINTLRILHYLLWIRLCWESLRPKCFGHFCAIFCTWCLCNICHQRHASCGSETGNIKFTISSLKSSYRNTSLKIVTNFWSNWIQSIRSFFQNSDSKAWPS